MKFLCWLGEKSCGDGNGVAFPRADEASETVERERIRKQAPLSRLIDKVVRIKLHPKKR